VAWLARFGEPLHVTMLTAFELGNALRFAEFRRLMSGEAAARALAQFESAMAAGRLVLQPCNLGRVVAVANRLSATHTRAGGHRSFDLLHVAAALEMGADAFLTFDARQRALARAEGLRLPLP
jgi:hypothetical protein